MTVFGILVVVAIAAVSAVVMMYNQLVAIRNRCIESWSNVETELKRRYDLIPNLINTVRGYADHERTLIEEVTTLREQAVANTGDAASQAGDESLLQSALGRLMVRLEAYPELKANTGFVELQRELANTEDRIQAALRFYNGNVRENNNKVQQFPSNILARIFNFGSGRYFELDIPEARNPIDVQFWVR